ncbi:MAG: hypothetical protein EBT03_13520 [Betaproteobacteria bacterium]|nr:hypothetical protein [Betaproteobacteria bacterium]NCA17314.1 hypothetical protein [Betaproteobacteria bacterium]
MTQDVTPKMSKEHELHLASILEAFIKDFSKKYRRGQAEHGGALWMRPCWSDAISEVIDLVAYVYTHKVQLAVIADLALKGANDSSVAAADSRAACVKILQVLQGMPGSEDKK